VGSVTNLAPVTVPPQPPIRITVQYVTSATPPNVAGGVQPGGQIVVSNWTLQAQQSFTWASAGFAAGGGPVFPGNSVLSQAVGDSPLSPAEQRARHAMQPAVQLAPVQPLQQVEWALVVSVDPPGSPIAVVP
jgi:hypothetical protein